MVNSALQVYLLKRAVHILSVPRLATRLGVSVELVQAWLEGRATMTEPMFSALVAVMIDLDRPPTPSADAEA